MSVAARYINRELVAIFIVTLVMLLLVALGGRFIGYLQDAAMGKFTGSTVLTIMALRMPEFIQSVAPFAMYVAIVLTLGRLYAEQEMVVLQGGGVGTAKLLKWVSAALGSVVAIVALLAWVITPLSQNALEDFLAEQQAESEFETLNAGSFHAYDRGSRVTYSRAMSDDRKVLYDVFLSQRLTDGRRVNVWAEEGTQETDEQNGLQYLILRDGKRYESGPTGVDLRVMEFGQLRQRLDSVERRPSRVEVEAMPTFKLGDDPESRAEWHWRMALPLFVLIGGLLAVGVSRVKPRQGRFAKVLPGMVLMLLYYLALVGNRNAIGEGQIPPALGLWLVHLVFAGYAAYQLRALGRPVATR